MREKPALTLGECQEIFRRLEDVPVDDGQRLIRPFQDFPSGTELEEVWRWLEAQNPEFCVFDAMFPTMLMSA